MKKQYFILKKEEKENDWEKLRNWEKRVFRTFV